MKGRRKPEAADDRILGSGTFVGTILAEAEQRRGDVLRLRAAIPDLPALAQRIADKEGVSVPVFSPDHESGKYRERGASSARLR